MSGDWEEGKKTIKRIAKTVSSENGEEASGRRRLCQQEKWGVKAAVGKVKDSRGKEREREKKGKTPNRNKVFACTRPAFVDLFTVYSSNGPR